MDLKQKPIKHLSKSAWIMFLAMNAGFVVDYVYLSGARARLLWELLTVADRKPTKSGGQSPLQCPGQVFT